jgi:hypothetical protein
MVPFLLFLFSFLVFGLVGYLRTASALRGHLRLDGPGPIARYVRRRNRLVLFVVLFVVVIAAVLEVFVYEWHSVLLDLQYGAGAEPVGVVTYGGGTGLSWAVYFAILLGTTLGLLAGSYFACRRGEGSTAIRPLQLA